MEQEKNEESSTMVHRFSNLKENSLLVFGPKTKAQVLCQRAGNSYELLLKNKSSDQFSLYGVELYFTSYQKEQQVAICTLPVGKNAKLSTISFPLSNCSSFKLTCGLEPLHDTSLRKNNMVADVARLHRDSDTTDVILVCGQRDLPCHKLLLGARSDVFAAMFRHTETKEVRENAVDLGPDVDFDTADKFLEFVYTDQVLALEDHAEGLLVLAEKYNVARLKALCEWALAKVLKVNNIVHFLQLALRHRASKLEQNALTYIVGHFKELKAREDWIEVSESSLEIVNKVLHESIRLSEKSEEE